MSQPIQSRSGGKFSKTRVEMPKSPAIPNSRTLWATKRAALESVRAKSQFRGGKLKRHWELFERVVQLLGHFLKFTPFHSIGVRNALNVHYRLVDIPFSNLPAEFDGYKILHITDTHFDFFPGIENAIVKAIKSIPHAIDMAILTGDYRNHVDGGFRNMLQPMQTTLDAIQAPDGIYATLGNHDCVSMVPVLEKMGIRVLANETVTLRRNKARISFTGIDDIHYFYTDFALQALENSPDNFKMLFAHSAELYAHAAENGYDFYLCGHTHGGQVCLPGGIPIITHHTAGRSRAKGRWRFGNLWGYTSPGAGVVGLPIRLFSRSEVTVIQLKRSRPSEND